MLFPRLGVPEAARPTTLRLNWLLLTTAGGWALYAAQYVMMGRQKTATLDVFIVLATVAVRMFLLRQREVTGVRIAAHVAIAISLVGLIGACILSGHATSMAAWYFLAIPLFAAYQEGARAALIWTCITAACFVVMSATHRYALAPEFVAQGSEILGGHLALLVVVFLFALAGRRAADRQIEAVAQRTRELLTSNEALTETTARLRELVQSLPAAVVVASPAGQVVLTNRLFFQMFPRSSESAALVEGVDMDLDEVREAVAGRLVDGDAFRRRFSALRSGRTLDLGRELVGEQGLVYEQDYVPILEGERYLGELFSYRDVSERKAVERLKSEFVSVVSHELRTPLTSIKGALRLIEGGVAGSFSGEAGELVRIATGNTDRLVVLIDDLLDLQKIEAGKLSMALVEVSPTELVARVVEAMRPLAEASSVRLVVGAKDPSEAHLETDPDRLAQVIGNLVTNAIKFSRGGDTVTVACRVLPRGIRLSVRDHGPGIGAADLPRLFRKFQQLDGSDTRSRGGTGLGLAISKAIVEQLGGTIGVESVPGEGATFWVELPNQHEN